MLLSEVTQSNETIMKYGIFSTFFKVIESQVIVNITEFQ